MKLRESLQRLEHHYQMIAIWESVEHYLQSTMEVPEKVIAVKNGVLSTTVGPHYIYEAQNDIRERLKYHRKMVEEYGEASLQAKTIPKDGPPPALQAPKKEDEPKPNGKKDDKKKPATKEVTEEPAVPEDGDAEGDEPDGDEPAAEGDEGGTE